jgi:hypothetical protein
VFITLKQTVCRVIFSPLRIVCRGCCEVVRRQARRFRLIIARRSTSGKLFASGQIG